MSSSEKFFGHRHHRFLRGKSQAFSEAISRAAYFDRDRPDLIAKERGDVINEFRGAAVVGILSYFEEIVTNFYPMDRSFRPSSPLFPTPRVGLVEFLNEIVGSWDGWGEFDGLMRIRHCFGHSAGRILDSHEPRLKDFEQWQKDGNILDPNGNVQPQYYALVDGRVRLESDVIYRARVLTMFALHHCGFIGPLKTYNLWKCPH